MSQSIELKTKKEVEQLYNKKYYEQHKTEHLAYMAEKLICEVCECTTTRAKRARHNRSKKHIRNLRIANIRANIRKNK